MDALRKKSLLLPSKRSASDTGHSRHPKDPETPAQQAGQRIQTAQGKGWCSCVRPSCRYPWQLVAPSLLAHLFGLLGLARDGANFVQQLRAPGEVWRGKRTARAVVVYVRASAPNTENPDGSSPRFWRHLEAHQDVDPLDAVSKRDRQHLWPAQLWELMLLPTTHTAPFAVKQDASPMLRCRHRAERLLDYCAGTYRYLHKIDFLRHTYPRRESNYFSREDPPGADNRGREVVCVFFLPWTRGNIHVMTCPFRRV